MLEGYVVIGKLKFFLDLNNIEIDFIYDNIINVTSKNWSGLDTWLYLFYNLNPIIFCLNLLTFHYFQLIFKLQVLSFEKDKEN